MDNYTIKKDIEANAHSTLFEALNYLTTPLSTDMSEEDVRGLIFDASEHYQYDGVLTYYEAFLIVGSSNFPDADEVDFTSCTTSLECLMQEGNSIAYQVYHETLSALIDEAVTSIMLIMGEAEELGYDGAFQFCASSLYGWAPHNYENDEGVCFWNDIEGKTHCFPQLLEGELYAIEGDVAGITFGACWTPEA